MLRTVKLCMETSMQSGDPTVEIQLSDDVTSEAEIEPSQVMKSSERRSSSHRSSLQYHHHHQQGHKITPKEFTESTYNRFMCYEQRRRRKVAKMKIEVKQINSNFHHIPLQKRKKTKFKRVNLKSFILANCQNRRRTTKKQPPSSTPKES